tara:strand:+ start:2937 stop:3251 length:315 start_codon:yes stop_codon:yes gene_type:complete
MDNTNTQIPEISKIKTGSVPPPEVTTQQQVTKSEKDNWHWFQVYTACIIKLILSIIAGSLVWKCNSKENLVLKVVFTILAVMFSEIYILYYAIYRVYMGNKCPA